METSPPSPLGRWTAPAVPGRGRASRAGAGLRIIGAPGTAGFAWSYGGRPSDALRFAAANPEEDGTAMNKRNLLLTTGGAAALGLALIALPVSSAGPQKPDASTIARLQQRIDELEAKLQAQIEREQNQQAVLADADAPEEAGETVILEKQGPARGGVLANLEMDEMNILNGG